MIRPFAVLALSLFALLPATAGAFTINVNNPQDLPDADPGDGVCNVDPFHDPDVFALCTLRAAVMEANATSIDTEPMVTILLKPGSNHVFKIAPADGDVTGANGDLDIARPMWIGVPEGSKTRARVSGNDLDKIFEFAQGAEGSTMHGLEIVDGRPVYSLSGEAAAIQNRAGHLTLSWLDVHANNANGYDRGAIYVHNGNLRLVDSSVRNNGSADIPTTGIQDNTSTDWTIERSSIYSNSGEGVRHISGKLHVLQSTIAHNGEYGVFSQTHDGLIISGSTIAYNGISQVRLTPNSVDGVQIYGSIIASSDPMVPLCEDPIESDFHRAWNLFSDGSCPTDEVFDFGNQIGAASLQELGNWRGPTATMPPLPGSDAVDFVDPSVCEGIVHDQRGLPRIVSYTGAQPARCDAGAVELQLPVIFSDGFDEAP